VNQILLKYKFYILYFVYSEHNLKFHMTFISVSFAEQEIFHTHCTDIFITDLCTKFHLAKSNYFLKLNIFATSKLLIYILKKRYLKTAYFSIVHAMKAYKGNEGIAPLILN
jgi:hypothetical protein